MSESATTVAYAIAQNEKGIEFLPSRRKTAAIQVNFVAFIQQKIPLYCAQITCTLVNSMAFHRQLFRARLRNPKIIEMKLKN